MRTPPQRVCVRAGHTPDGAMSAASPRVNADDAPADDAGDGWLAAADAPTVGGELKR